MAFILKGLKNVLGFNQNNNQDSEDSILKFEIEADLYLVKGDVKDRILKKGAIKFLKKKDKPFTYFLQCEDPKQKVEPYFFPIYAKMIVDCFTSKKGDKNVNFSYMNYQFQLPQTDDSLRIRLDNNAEQEEVQSIIFGNYLSKLIYEVTYQKNYNQAENENQYAQFLREVKKSDSSMISTLSSKSDSLFEDDISKLNDEFSKNLTLDSQSQNKIKKYPDLGVKQEQKDQQVVSKQDQDKLNKVLLDLCKETNNKFLTEGAFFQVSNDDEQIYKQLEKLSVFCISDEGDYNFKLKVYNLDGVNTYKISLTQNLSEFVNLQENWIKWLDLESNQQTALLLLFRFNKEHGGMTAKYLISQCKYENNIRQSLQLRLNSKKEAEKEEAVFMEMAIKQNHNYDAELFNEYDQYEDLEFDNETAPQIINSQNENQNDNENRVMSQAKILNKTFITKGTTMGVYQEDEENPSQGLQFLLNLPVIKSYDNHEINPQKMMMSNSDTRIILLDQNNKKRMVEVDLERAKVVREFTADKYGQNPIDDFTEYQKKGVKQGDIFNAINSRNIFRMDPRISKGQVDCITEKEKIYNSKNNFTCITTNQEGQFCIGKENGEVSFYTDIGNAKNTVQTFGDCILGLDSTRDGKWLLATCEKYLILLPTMGRDQDQTTLFQRQLKYVERRTPFKLTLNPEDIFKFKINKLSFSPAKFDWCEKERERFIVTSVDKISIMWNFKSILRGDTYDYEIKNLKENIKTIEFKYDQPDTIYSALNNEICLVKTKKTKNNSKKNQNKK